MKHVFLFVTLRVSFIFLLGIFEDDFIEERRQGLEAFVNRYEQVYNSCILDSKYLYAAFETQETLSHLQIVWRDNNVMHGRAILTNFEVTVWKCDDTLFESFRYKSCP